MLEPGEFTALDRRILVLGRRSVVGGIYYPFVYLFSVHSWARHGTPVEVGGQLSGVGFLLSCGFQGSNSGHQTCQQVTLAAALSHRPPVYLSSEIVSCILQDDTTVQLRYSFG